MIDNRRVIEIIIIHLHIPSSGVKVLQVNWQSQMIQSRLHSEVVLPTELFTSQWKMRRTTNMRQFH